MENRQDCVLAAAPLFAMAHGDQHQPSRIVCVKSSGGQSSDSRSHRDLALRLRGNLEAGVRTREYQRTHYRTALYFHMSERKAVFLRQEKKEEREKQYGGQENKRKDAGRHAGMMIVFLPPPRRVASKQS
jgi:hypothetical protein